MEKKKTPAKIFWITKDAGINRILWYLILTALLSAFCFITLHVWLLPYSIAFNETGVMTPGYFLYAAIGILFSTPGPFVAVLIHSLFIERTGLKFMMKGIFRTEKKLRTVIVTGIFCLMALVYALICGTPNGSPWYMFILGLIVMIPFVGIAEETGWRGVLQPELDKKLPYPVSVIITAFIWCIWHYSAWIDPTSRHYDDSFIGFAITIFIWSFAMAAIYKVTKSVFACAFYHAFIDSIGAVYDWNALFDAFPGDLAVNAFRVVWLGAAIGLWVWGERKDGWHGEKGHRYEH